MPLALHELQTILREGGSVPGEGTVVPQAVPEEGHWHHNFTPLGDASLYHVHGGEEVVVKVESESAFYGFLAGALTVLGLSALGWAGWGIGALYGAGRFEGEPEEEDPWWDEVMPGFDAGMVTGAIIAAAPAAIETLGFLSDVIEIGKDVVGIALQSAQVLYEVPFLTVGPTPRFAVEALGFVADPLDEFIEFIF